jgi:hypothetical protein
MDIFLHTISLSLMIYCYGKELLEVGGGGWVNVTNATRLRDTL